MSDADTEKKLCQNSGQTSVNSGTVDCQAGPQTNKLGLVAFYVDASAGNRPTWPNEKHTSGTGKGPENVAKNIVALTKDEKVKVAEHLAKSIEGGEVVEIRSVSSTSVMVNACYVLRECSRCWHIIA